MPKKKDFDLNFSVSYLKEIYISFKVFFFLVCVCVWVWFCFAQVLSLSPLCKQCMHEVLVHFFGC
jgi:hypothetical protein